MAAVLPIRNGGLEGLHALEPHGSPFASLFMTDASSFKIFFFQ